MPIKWTSLFTRKSQPKDEFPATKDEAFGYERDYTTGEIKENASPPRSAGCFGFLRSNVDSTDRFDPRPKQHGTFPEPLHNNARLKPPNILAVLADPEETKS